MQISTEAVCKTLCGFNLPIFKYTYTHFLHATLLRFKVKYIRTWQNIDIYIIQKKPDEYILKVYTVNIVTYSVKAALLKLFTQD